MKKAKTIEAEPTFDVSIDEKLAARKAYEAYYQGKVIVAFDLLPEEVKAMWAQAATAVIQFTADSIINQARILGVSFHQTVEVK